MNKSLKVILAAVVFVCGGAIAEAQTQHTNHDAGMDHSAHGQVGDPGRGVLTEPGQSAFAALSEVVRVLEADAGTDWSRVDLTGLLDVSRFDAAPLIAFIAAKETNYGTETDGRISC